MKPTALAAAAVTLLSLASPSPLAARTWTSAAGRSLEAELAKYDGTTAWLKTSTGQVIEVPARSLSAADQSFLKTQPTTARPALKDQALPPPETRKWPELVEVPSAEIDKLELVTKDPGARQFVYRSASFEFSSQGKLLPSLMKEVARTFEATKRLVSALPWGITCRPPDGMERYLAALYETRADYIAAGGPENSGGVYMTKDKTFRIPFQSLGITRKGQSYSRDENFNNDTLVHEITHQMMHDILPYLPKWCIEGSAEFTEMMPYKSGTFRLSSHERGVKDYVEARTKHGTVRLPRLADLFRLSREDWDRQSMGQGGPTPVAVRDSSPSRQAELYQQSALLVYYFNFLDGEAPKTGLRWLRFMDAVRTEAGKWQTYETDFKDYRAKMEEFFKLPGVKKNDDGTFSYPANLKPPQPPDTPEGKDAEGKRKDYSATTSLKHLNLLLEDRSEAQVEQEMQTKFTKLGLKLGF